MTAHGQARDSSVRHQHLAPRRGVGFAAMTGLALLALAARPALAHDTWLLPAQSRVEPGKPVTLAMTSGMAFPQNETPIDEDRIARSGVRLGGKDNAFTGRQEGEQSLQLTAQPPQAGLATVWIVLKPRTLELTAEDVQHYLEEIGSPPAVVARWQATPEPRRWRESYRKNVKTYVRVGESIDDATWAQPVGAPLELVPASNPTALRAGDRLTLLLLRDGKPAPGIAVGLVRAGETAATNRETDATGRASFTLERGGWYLARVTDLRPATGKDLDWESEFATLTFEVQEAAKPHAHGSR